MTFLLALVSLFTSPAVAQDTASLYAWDPVVDTSITAVSALCFLGTTYVVEPAIPAEILTNPPGGLDAIALDRWEPSLSSDSYVLLYSSMLAGLVANGVAGARAGDAWSPVGIYLESIGVTGTLVNVLKLATDRPRPYTHMSDPPDDVLAETQEADATMSFPSGHTGIEGAVTFATASILVAHGARPAPVYVTAGVLTGAMGVLRVAAGKHYPTDVLMGAAIGAAVGLSVPALHLASRDLADAGDGTMSAVSMGLGSSLPGSARVTGFSLSGRF